MNKTFKVARSLTRGTVVTSEKASSYQGKAVKTVIAAAVALVAGSAMAAAVPTQDAAGNIKVTGNITVTGSEAVPSKNGTVLQYDDASKTWKDMAEQSGAVSYDNVIFLDNGALKVQAKADGTAAGDFSVKEVVGTGTLTVAAVNKAGSVTTAKGSTLQIGTAGLGNHEGDNLTIAFTSTGATAKTAEQGVATIELAGSAEIGHVGDLPKKNGVVNFTVDENTNARIESSVANEDLSINNAAFSNSGRLAFKAVDGKAIALKSAMDTTNDKGVYVFENALTTTDGAAYTGTTVYVGAADATDDAAKGAKTFLTKGATIGNGESANELTKTSTFTADTLTLADTSAAGFSVIGGGKAELKTVNVTAGEFSTFAATDTDYNGYANVGTLTASKTGKVTLGGTTDVGTLTILAGEDHTANGTTTIGTLTIGDLAAKANAKLTVEADAELVVTGDTILQAKETGSAGTLSVNSAASLELQGKTAVNEYGVLTIENTTMASLGEVTVNKGSFSISGTSAEDYEADIQSLTVTDGKASIDGVEIVLNSVNIAESQELTVGGTTAATVQLGTLTGKGTYKQDNGALTTAYSTVVNGAYADSSLKTQDNVKLNAAVVLNLTGAANYTVKDYTAVKKATGSTELHLKDGQFVGENDALAKLDDVSSVGNDVENSPVTTEVAGGANMTVVPTTDNAIVGSVTVTRAANSTSKIEDLTIGATDKSITLRGYNGTIVNVADADKHDTKFKLVLDNVTLGQEDSDMASYNGVVEIGAEGLTIGGGSFTLGNIAGATGSGPLNITGGDLTLVGTAGQTVEYTAADGTKKSYTTTTFGRTVTPAVSPDTNPTIADYTNTITLSGGHFLALGNYTTEAAAARQALVEEAIADSIASNGSVTDDEKRALDQATNVFYVGQQSYLASGITNTKADEALFTLMDLSKIAAGAGYTSDRGIVEVKDGQEGNVSGQVKEIRLSNITDKVVNVDDYGVASINVGKMFNGHTFVFDTSFYANGVTDSNGMAEVVANEGQLALAQLMGFNSFGTLNQAVRGYNVPTDQITNAIYKNFADWQEDAQTYADEKAIASGIYEVGTTLDNIDSAELAEGVSEAQAAVFYANQLKAFAQTVVNAEHAATNMAALGGAFSASLDAQNEVVGALNRRLSKANVNAVRGEVGVTPWVDVFGTTNEAKRLYGSNAGYEADIYGAVLGFDYTASCGGTLGVAFNIGTGDGNSVGAGQKVENDQDFYGVSLYAAKEFGGFNTMLDLGYMTVENDLSTSSAFFGKTSEKLDADLFTVGFGAEYALDAGVAKVTPHAGIRMTRLSMDDSKYGADYDDMTIYQLPLGVAVSSTFETNGWKLAPMADVSVVPTFGDKDAVATFQGGVTDTVRVVDTNPVQGTLGVEAQNGAFTFGLNYRLTAGGDDRMNNSFNANVRYAF